jgi:hypothetical protein
LDSIPRPCRSVFILESRSVLWLLQDGEMKCRVVDAEAFLKGVASPLNKYCFRAMGFYFFKATEEWFHLAFPKYVV